MLYTAQSERWKLNVAPETGASVANLAVRTSSVWLPLLRETPEGAIEANNPSKFASFTLAPFSNRIRDARFRFEGRDYALRATSPDGSTQHGDVRGRPWTVTYADERTLEATFDSRDVPDFNYPFPLTVSVHYETAGDEVRTHLALTNVGEAAMPAGFGLHPYFNRFVRDFAEMRLEFSAAGLYETDASFIPHDGMQPVPPERDFSVARAFGEQDFNHVYGGWDGYARLSWPGSGITVEMRCDPIFSHLVLFTAPDGTLGIEPVTHAADGFNLFSKGVSGTGVRVLEAGETLSGTVTLRLVNG